MSIAVNFPYNSHYVDILGSKMHYVELGAGDPILFLHGVPTSSYLWRNVMPYLGRLGRCIAPDLIGFGKSDKPKIAYTIKDHIHYMEKFIDALELTQITFVLHGWGSIIGFDYAMRHETKCRALAFYESYLRLQNENEISLPYQEQILKWQGRDNIPELAVNGAQFVEKVISQGTLRQLSEKEMAHYREPFQAPDSERPIQQYLQDLPGGTTKNEVDKIITEYSKKLIHSTMPKLMLYSLPGFITTISTVMWVKQHLPNVELVDIGEDLHYAQESNPTLMGESISVWLQALEQIHN